MSPDVIDRTAVLRAVAEQVRWRIVEQLAVEELCVCHLVEDLGLAQPLVSHHLRVLREAGVVEPERFRQWTYYRLVPGALAAIASEISALAESGRGAGRKPAAVLLMRPSLARRALAEYCGTAFLVAVVVGSGIAAQKLSPGDAGLQLLENAAATAGGLVALILAFGPVSGAHFNPVVSAVDASFGGLAVRDLPAYVAAQIAGAVSGAVIANLMFELDAVSWSTHSRSSGGLWLGEVVATVGLLMVVFGAVRSGRASAAPFAVGAYIGGAYFFTSSTSFANPAVTVGRAFTDTFAGIEPSSAPAFIGMQLVGGIVAVLLIRVLYPDIAEVAGDVVVAHAEDRT